MKQRLLWLIKLYAAYIATFVAQKVAFFLACRPADTAHGIGDWLQVAVHGLLLDVPVAGYLISLPLLVAVATAWLPCTLKLRTIALPYHIVAAVGIALMAVADISIYPFWKFKLDATIFYYTDSPKDALASVSTAYVALRVAIIIATAAALTWLYCHATPRRLAPLRGTAQSVATTAVLLALTAPLVVSIRGGLGESTANVGRVYFSTDEFLNHAAINPCFSMLASLGKADDYASEFDYFDEDTRRQLFDGLYKPTPQSGDTLLNTRRPNVIVIIMEGFGGQFIESVSGRTDIAPNFNRLAREGVLFTNCYSNSFRTDRGTVSTLSGYPSFPTLSVMKLPMKSRTLPCLAASLNAEGYTSSFLYGGDINFTNMQSYLRTGGYSSITSDVDFPAKELRDNPWGANDDVTFDRLAQMVGEAGSEPWHICFLTLSSHEPFKVPYDRLDNPVANAFAFTDHCLGNFVERIRQTPAWRDLLIVCLPDHGFSFPAGITHQQHHHNAMLWIGGAVAKPRTITTLMNQSDMAATLLGQMGIDHDDYTFSRDVTSPDYDYPFAFYTFKEGAAFADSTGNTVYDIIGNRVAEDCTASAVADSAAATQRRTDKAKAILQSIYDDLGQR